MKISKRHIASILVAMFCLNIGKAQDSMPVSDFEDIEIGREEFFPVIPDSVSLRNKNSFQIWSERNNIFNRLSAGISLGSMGIGLDLKTNVTKWIDIRAGVDWMPKFKVPLYFNLDTYSDGLPTGSFKKVAQMLYDQTGIELDETVHMYGVGAMTNFKLFIDVYPVPSNRHWHVTAGFLAGTAKIGRAYNDREEMPTLVALNIYNRAYEYFTNLQSVFDVPLGGGTYMDPDLVRKLQDKFRQYGRMGIHIGDFKDGRPYIMEPSPDGTVTAKALVNHFKPYIGAGYETELDKTGKWKVGLDLGVLFWGGAPNVINHDYKTDTDINFTKDLINLRGKVDRYVKLFKAFPVYPLLEIRFSYSIL